ncbi:class I SAM-dependent methyltransferase [Paenibacillus sp. GCM10012306]|uniref:class I SAM-dependent methyltransferase n=1 Tax=Paenibacillus sp. GCM10012306 TaxID=3317342 RepID=UPI00360D1FB8
MYDIGGGIGVYSRWLAELGHEVHMFELAPKAVEYARALQDSKQIVPIHTIEVADARSIARPDNSADFVLLMGPLYHLPERKERMAAIHEAKRVLKPGGIIIVSAISRFSSTLWGLSVYGGQNDYLEDPIFSAMIKQELTNGQHIRPEAYPSFISRAFFHLPEELNSELAEAGFMDTKMLAVEGPVWIVPTFTEKWKNEHSRAELLKICSLVEEQESLLGMSPHMLAVAKK